MRLSFVLLALLFSVHASLACPANYHVCGDGTLCCR